MTVKRATPFTADTSRGRSRGLWGDCPLQAYRNGDIAGTWDGDDFTNWGPITAVTTDAHVIGAPYMGFNSSGGTHTLLDGTGGVVIVTEATDNEGTYLRKNSWPFQISALLGDLWFECRVKTSAITDNQIGTIFGLWDNTACSVVVPLSTANPPIMATTGNFVGFRGPEEDAGGINFVYDSDDAGQTTDAEVVMVTLAHQLVADTYVKLGFKFSRNYQGTRVAKLEGYVNGVPLGSPKTIPDATGTDFPADVRLGFMFGHRLGASTSSLTSCDWWECYQNSTPALQQ